MARDYKNTAAKAKKKAHPIGSSVSFLSGLGIGLLVAFGVYMLGPYREAWTPERDVEAEIEIDQSARLSGRKLEEELTRAMPEREFDFYKILPEIEVKVPDWEIEKTNPKGADESDAGTYVLQVGSFKQHEDADRAKAKLALLGIQAKIHRVVINGQDIWYRVHVGPFSDKATLQAMRAKLIGSGNDFILLKIGEGAG